jgi:hypothetical protein
MAIIAESTNANAEIIAQPRRKRNTTLKSVRFELALSLFEASRPSARELRGCGFSFKATDNEGE